MHQNSFNTIIGNSLSVDLKLKGMGCTKLKRVQFQENKMIS